MVGYFKFVDMMTIIKGSDFLITNLLVCASYFNAIASVHNDFM
jgi:hypothetical protein